MLVGKLRNCVFSPPGHGVGHPMKRPMYIREKICVPLPNFVPNMASDFFRLQKRGSAKKGPNVLFLHMYVIFRINEKIISIDVLREDPLMRER
jgi:hypothetical protein